MSYTLISIFNRDFVRNFIYILLVVFAAITTNASNLDYRFHHLDLEDGLPQSSVLCVFHDSKGFIWFGTYGGLCRFDGVNLKVFTPSENNHHTINFGTVYKIEEGLDGTLYIATGGGGLNVYNPDTEIFSYFKNDSTSTSIVSNIIWDILIASDSTLWIASYNGVSHFYPKTKKFISYPFNEKRVGGYPEYTALSLYEDKYKYIWIGSYGGGIGKYTKETNKFEFYPNEIQKNKDYNNNIVSQITPYSTNSVLLTTDGGIFKFNIETKKYSVFYQGKTSIFSTMVDADKNVWLATENEGIKIVSTHEVVDEIRHDLGNKYSLPTDNLSNIYQDNNETIWVGLSNKGVAYFSPEDKYFYHYYKKNNGSFLVGNEVYGLAEDQDENIWVGTTAGLSIINPKERTSRNLTYNGTNKSISENRIWDILYDPDGFMWLGLDNGLDKYSFSTKTFQHFEYDPNDSTSLPNNEVFCLERDKNGDIWAGTYQGLARYEKKSNSWISYNTQSNSGLPNKIIWFIFSDSKGQLWLGSDAGLYKYDFETDSFNLFGEINNSNSFLATTEISYITEDKEGVFWIGTDMGLVKFIPELNQIQRFGMEEGLPNPVIYGILESGDNIWFTSNLGLTKMNKFTEDVSNFDVTDGLQSNEFNTSALKAQNGNLLFGGINGITSFHPESVMASNNEPNLYFTKLSLNGITVHPNDERFSFTPLKQSILSAGVLDLSYNEKLIIIDFAALEYTHTKKIQYRYRILPNSKKWINLNDKNSVTFTNLPPGKYDLEIQCTNTGQAWLNNTKTLKIIIHPPFYKQKWFYILEFFTTFLLILWYIKRRMGRVKKINIRLEQTVTERTEEIQAQKEELEVQRDRIAEQKAKIEKFAEDLEYKIQIRTEELLEAKENAVESDRLKSAFLANMSHEIRTPMNAIIGFSDLLSSTTISEKEKSNYIGLIRTNSNSLLKLLNDILDISIIESGKIYLSTKKISVTKFMEHIFDQFQQEKSLKEKPRVELKLHNCTLQNVLINTDAQRLNQILSNLIDNAIKYTSKGEIKISAYKKGENIMFKIKDSGIGIHPDNVDKIFDRFHKINDDDTNPYRGSGLGLAISKKLIELMGGEIWVESKPTVGSVFYISLPGAYIQDVNNKNKAQ